VRPLLRDRRAAFGVAVLALVAAAGVAAPLVTGGRPTVQGDIVATRFLPPLTGDRAGGFHVLGTDRFGRDVWTRLVYGARVSLAVGTLAVLLSIALGVAVGAAVGFGPGLVQLPLLALTDFALALPRVVLLLVLAALWRPSAALVVIVLGLTGWMPVARLVQAEVRSLAVRPFVEEFSLRGGILDVFSPAHDVPHRIEFFGDAVESIRQFDPDTQRSVGQARESTLVPMRELAVRREGVVVVPGGREDQEQPGRRQAATAPVCGILPALDREQ